MLLLKSKIVNLRANKMKMKLYYTLIINVIELTTQSL